MNKTFKDPNTKYSEQGTPIAQAKSVADSIATVEEAVTGLGTGVATLAEEVTSLEQAISIIPVPEATDDGKVVTATNDGGYTLADVDALPAISAGDAGKVLTVNAGETGAEWAVAGGGGVDNAVLAHIYYDGNSDGYVCDKQYSELKTAIDNGKCVLIMYEGYPTSVAISTPRPNSPVTAQFLTCAKNANNDFLIYTNLQIQSDGSIVETETSFTLTKST